MGICEDTSIFKESILISCRMMSESLLGNISQNPSPILSFTLASGFSRLLQIHTHRGKDKKKHAFTVSITKKMLLVKILHTLALHYSSLSFIFSFTHSIWGFYIFSTPYQHSCLSPFNKHVAWNSLMYSNTDPLSYKHFEGLLYGRWCSNQREKSFLALMQLLWQDVNKNNKKSRIKTRM